MKNSLASVDSFSWETDYQGFYDTYNQSVRHLDKIFLDMTSLHDESRFTIENNVLKGKEVFYSDDFARLGESILTRMANNLDSVGQIDAITGEEYTFGKMREWSVRCALWMRSQGLRPRDVVAVCSENHMDLAMPCFAALYLGAVPNPWDPISEPVDVFRQMNITKPKMVFVDEGSAPVVAEAAKKAKLDLKIIVFSHLTGFLEFESVIAEPRVDEVEKFVCEPIETSGETALILFSSGSTGLPKGIALSHGGCAMQFHQSKAFGMAGNVCLNFAPACWINGIFDMLWSVLLIIPRIVTPHFEVGLACSLIEKYKVSWLCLSPTMIDALVKSEAARKCDLSSVTRVVDFGSSLSTASFNALSELLPNALITSAYGMTEFTGQIAIQTAKSPPGSVGQILENYQLKVIDPDTGRSLGPNQKGEILMKSRFMMNFYYENPEETAKVIDAEGWLHSGDLGYFNEDGEVFAIDRLKDIIRSSDYDISPSEIESVILSHPGVKEVAVVGQTQPDGRVLAIGFVVRAENSSSCSKQVTEADIFDLIASELLDSRKRLGAGIRFVDQLPKTSSNKIRRVVLRDLARTMVTI